MNRPYPQVYTKSLSEQKKLFYRLHEMGYRFCGRNDVHGAWAGWQMNHNTEIAAYPYLYIRSGNLMAGMCKKHSDNILLNSPDHMIAYLKGMK